MVLAEKSFVSEAMMVQLEQIQITCGKKAYSLVRATRAAAIVATTFFRQ